MSYLVNDLNSIWESRIEKSNFDMLKNQINFQLSTIENGENKEQTLTFRNVSSFFFIQDTGESRFHFYEYENDNFLELSSIGYHEDGIGNIFINSQESWIKQYNANFNFSLEIGGWGGILFIEAGIIEINGKVYHTKKLDNSSVE